MECGAGRAPDRVKVIDVLQLEPLQLIRLQRMRERGVRVDKKVETSKKLSQKQLYPNRLYAMAGEAKAESEM